MYKLNELCQKLNILLSEELIEQLKSAGYKLENGLISGTGIIEGKKLNAEDGIAFIIAKSNMALAKKEEGNISSPQSNTAPQYEVQNPFNMSVQDVVQTGQDQMAAAAQTGYALGVETSNMRTAAFWDGYLNQTAYHQQANIKSLLEIDRAIINGSNVDVSGIVRDLGEGKYRPAFPQ